MDNTMIIYKTGISIAYGAISFLVSFYLMLFICFMVKTLRPTGTDKKKHELSKKNKNRKLEEGNKNTEQRQALSKNGICYLVGNYNLSPGAYLFLIRPLCGILTVLTYLFITKDVSPIMFVLFIVGDIGFDLFIKNQGKNEERQMEWDIYKALTNVHIQLTTGAYLEDCLRMIAKGAIHPRFSEAMDELIRNLGDKTKTTSESIEILKTRFSSERIMTFCKILETFITYGPVDNVFNDMKTELKDMMDTGRDRTANDIRHRYNFSAGWMSMLLLIIGLMFFDKKFGDNELISNGIVQFIFGIERLFEGIKP